MSNKTTHPPHHPNIRCNKPPPILLLPQVIRPTVIQPHLQPAPTRGPARDQLGQVTPRATAPDKLEPRTAHADQHPRILVHRRVEFVFHDALEEDVWEDVVRCGVVELRRAVG